VEPGIGFAGRTPADPADTLETEIDLVDGIASQTGTGGWGDYTSMRVDPSDDKTFYYTNEYLTYTGNTNWSTAVSKVQFTTCQ
jgi:hypothetical protein